MSDNAVQALTVVCGLLAIVVFALVVRDCSAKDLEQNRKCFESGGELVQNNCIRRYR